MYQVKIWCGKKKYRKGKERLILKRKLVHLLGGKCVDCGYSEHLAALDFDHIDPKTKVCSVSTLLSKGKSYQEVEREAVKCVIRCANCHRIKTHPSATWNFEE